MERSYRQRRSKEVSASSSSTGSTGLQSQRFSSKPANRNSINSNHDAALDCKTRRSTSSQQKGDEPNIPSLVGTCPHMCPAEERAQRERLRDLAVFERLNGNPGKTSPNLAVKKFCRTISTKNIQPSDVRSLSVLEDTLNYLLNLLDSREHSFEVVHDFIFDRTRSIRQDLSMQNLVNDKVIHMYEEMVKFHVISHHKLRTCSSNSNMSSVHHLNLEQLTKALTSLYNLYDENQSSNSNYENETEFRSFYVLLHLGSNSQSMGESLSLWFRRVPSSIIKSKEMCFARRVLRFFRMGNFKRFFSTTAAEASYLQYYIIEPYINEVRALAVSCINNGGYKLHPYPLAHLSKLLMMKESDAESFCKACGLETCTDDVGNKLLPTKQTTFCRPKGEFPNYTFLGLEQLERPARENVSEN